MRENQHLAAGSTLDLSCNTLNPEISHNLIEVTDAMSSADVLTPDEDALEIWESDRTRPPQTRTSAHAKRILERAFQSTHHTVMQHPFLPAAEIRNQQLERIRHLVEIAYADIPVYREKYEAAGFRPSDLRSFDDIQRIPVITKSELIAAFPDRCVNPRFNPEDLFPTRSSGSSGQTLLIRVDLDAIVTDTVQGVRQFVLQSGLKYRPDHLLTHVYTVPWWFPSVGNDYRMAFISSLIPPAEVARHLGRLEPHVLSLYPSNLKALLPYRDEFLGRLYAVVTHSEYSSRSERAAWSRQLGVPVLDEYSSEEATRIALEMPSGEYHVCEDTIHLDVLDPETLEPQAAGQSGLAVITNLLNEAMPFIRYVQGDYVTRPVSPNPSAIGWSQLASVDGRANDAFVNKHGREVPAGSILDITYRWMFDQGVNVEQFELVQEQADLVRATFKPGPNVPEARVERSVRHLEDLLSLCLEHPVSVAAHIVSSFPPRTGKKRPIRREFGR